MAVVGTLGDREKLPENPTVQELTHGGFRDNVHHNWIEGQADDRHMARDVLTQTGTVDHMEQDGVSEIMSAASPVGKEDWRQSPWSKSNGG